MTNYRKWIGTGMLLGLALGLAWIAPLSASRGAQPGGQAGAVTPEGIPAYHSQLPDGPLPATLAPSRFEQPQIQNAYAIAARIKKTLYQQPCYCHCDRSQGHGSLLDCFVSRHGAGCDICMLETFYASEQLKAGKTAAQIRDGIVRGDWQKVDVTKYQRVLPTGRTGKS